MSIKSKEVYYHEFVYETNDPVKAIKQYRDKVRTKRLNDLYGTDSKMSNSLIAGKINEINQAIFNADKEVTNDNAEFIKAHSIDFSALDEKNK